MSLYKPHTTHTTFSPIGSPVFGPKREDEPSLLDKLDIVFFTDAEVEGQKRGIAKASRVYAPILRNLEEKYKMLEALGKKGKEQLGNEIQEQINFLKEKEDLEQALNEKMDHAGEKIGIPAGTIGSASSAGMMIIRRRTLPMMYTRQARTGRRPLTQNGPRRRLPPATAPG